jgi:hypothetical protein
MGGERGAKRGGRLERERERGNLGKDGVTLFAC